jgi:hypothetical protein
LFFDRTGQTCKPAAAGEVSDLEFDEHMIDELRDGLFWMLARPRGTQR